MRANLQHIYVQNPHRISRDIKPLTISWRLQIPLTPFFFSFQNNMSRESVFFRIFLIFMFAIGWFLGPYVQKIKFLGVENWDVVFLGMACPCLILYILAKRYSEIRTSQKWELALNNAYFRMPSDDPDGSDPEAVLVYICEFAANLKVEMRKQGLLEGSKPQVKKERSPDLLV